MAVLKTVSSFWFRVSSEVPGGTFFYDEGSVDIEEYNVYIVFMDSELRDIIEMEVGPVRTAALCEWIQNLYPDNEDKPVLVGGSAVELYTGGAYITGDMDFVGIVSPEVEKKLRTSGFIKKGRHWIHEGGKLYIEFPGDGLTGGDEALEVLIGDHSIIIISPEDIVVDRLSAWLFWRSLVDGVNAFLLYRAQHETFDHNRLEDRAQAAEATRALNAVKDLHKKFPDTLPSKEALEQWTQKAI